MKTLLAGAAAALAVVSAVPAFANTTSISCGDYVIALSDEVAIAGEAQAGGTAAFQRVVCERSGDAADIDNVTRIPVFIQELGIATRVVIIPVDSE